MAHEIVTPNKLSPDGSGRFYVMAKLLESLNGGAKNTVNILDVGGSSLYMTEVLKTSTFNHTMTTIDILPKPSGFKGKYIQGDATKMSFSDESFDTVISTDVLEHIPAKKKADFVKECIRVAKDFVIIAAPYDTDGVDQSERATNDLNIKLFKQGQVWLEEHFEYTKPSLSKTVAIAEKMGYETYVIGTNNIYMWLLSTHANLIDAKIGLNKKAHIKANEFLSEVIVKSGDMAPPYYRHFVVITKKKITSTQKNAIEEMISPKIDHGPTIEYTHRLLDLITESMSTKKRELEKYRTKSENELHELRQKIDSLQHELAEKDELIRRSRHYLKLVSAPRKVAKRIISNK